VELHRGELESLPLADASCDAAVAVLVLSYVAEVSIVLAEAARILKPCGRLVVVDLARHADDAFARRMGQSRLGFAPEDLQKAFALAGLEAVRVRPLPPEAAAKGPALLLATASKSL
jgi:ArsR family transcriptional regulator